MSVEIWHLEKDLCRCCHAEGSFDNLAEPKKYLQSEEIYSDMIKNFLNIEIVPVPGEMCAMTYKICEACISRLRDAVSFKKQVQDCEQKFLELYYNNAIRVSNKNESTKLMQNTLVKDEFPKPFLIDFKEEDFSHIDGETDDEDYQIKEDDVSNKNESTKLMQNTLVKEEFPKPFLIDFKEDFSHIDSDTDDEDCQIKEDDEDQLTDKETNITSKRKHKTKDKLKDKPKLNCGRPEKSKDETQREAEKVKKDGSRSFRLQPGDYRRDGDRYACCRCDKKYDKMCSLRFHIKTKHYKIPRLTCPYCMKGFMSQTPLTIHKLKDHNIDERYYCKACKEMFNRKSQLKRHTNSFHMLGERYKCDLCDYESFSSNGLNTHKDKHKTSKDYNCRFCKKSFLRKKTLVLHEKIHTGDRKKVCKVCSQAFVQKASLNYHMTKYHPNVNF